MEGTMVTKRKMLKEIQRNMVKNFLDTVVMVRLKSCSPLSGYDVMDYVQQKYGVLISSGTVYSLLYSMERKGLLKGEFSSGKRLYSLTDEGMKSVQSILDSSDEIERFVGTLLAD
jgi:DNA-binding PadR family transcriptional regulator